MLPSTTYWTPSSLATTATSAGRLRYRCEVLREMSVRAGMCSRTSMNSSVMRSARGPASSLPGRVVNGKTTTAILLSTDTRKPFRADAAGSSAGSTDADDVPEASGILSAAASPAPGDIGRSSVRSPGPSNVTNIATANGAVLSLHPGRGLVPRISASVESSDIGGADSAACSRAGGTTSGRAVSIAGGAASAVGATGAIAPRSISSMRARVSGSGSTSISRFNSATSASAWARRSEEHTSELQSQFHLVCRLLLEKKNKNHHYTFLLKKTMTNIVD